MVACTNQSKFQDTALLCIGQHSNLDQFLQTDMTTKGDFLAKYFLNIT